MIELRFDDAWATIDDEDGGRLISLVASGVELLVQEDPDPGPIPRAGSFLMAPWVAEMAEGRLVVDGVEHRLPPNVGRHAVHGLVMRGPWQVVAVSDRDVVLERELAAPWPLGGRARQEITLDPAGIRLGAAVVAGRSAMPAALGWHPWFRCTDPGATRVRVSADRRLDLDAELLPRGRSLPLTGVDDLREGPILGDRAIDVVYEDVAWPVTLELPDGTLRIEADPAMTIGVVYTSPGAVCIEPWSAWPDAFRMAARGFPSGAVWLEPGGSLRRWRRWSWTMRA